MASRTASLKLTVGDWLVLAIGLMFTAMGGAIRRTDRNVGIITLSLSGLGACVAAGNLWRKSRYGQPQPLEVTLLGGVPARRGWAWVIPWDAIAHLEASELQHNPVLLISLSDPGGIRVLPSQCTPRCRRVMASNLRWVGAPWLIMTSHCGLDLLWLVQALQRYLEHPDTREELSRRLLPGA